jgi:glycosyltransferase involved in cell wall biosynthesis
MHASSARQPLLSIAMPVFNSRGTIAQAIASILNQSFTDWELLIIDDGSTDDTFEIARSFRDPRIIISRDDRNRRLPTRLNECIKMARGKFIARMDGDDVAYPDRLKAQLDFLDHHPEVDLVAGWIVVFRSDGTALGALRGFPTHEEIWPRPWMGMLMPHPTWTGRTEWFRRNPYRLINAAEDQDLLIRTYDLSRFATLPKVVLGYREDGLSLPYRLAQRWQVCKSIVSHHSQQREYTNVARCLVSQAAKGVAEIVAISTGLDYRILKARAPLIHKDEVDGWRAVWQDVRRIAVQNGVGTATLTA